MKLLFSILLLGMINICNAQTVKCDCGVVLHNLNVYDKKTKKYIHSDSIWPSIKIWYNKKFVIEEIKGIIENIDGYNKSKKETVIERYTFIDLSKKAFYDYASFSDTARILEKYTQSDSIGIAGGWNFYYPVNFIITEQPESLSDTIIDKIPYKRFKFINSLKQSNFRGRHIAYVRCDKKGSLFQFAKTLGDKIGCPIVRIDWSDEPFSNYKDSMEIVFLSDSLTHTEQKIFNAWERNEKKYPVSK